MRPLNRTLESVQYAMRVTLCRRCYTTLWRCFRRGKCCKGCDHQLGILPREPDIGWQVVEEKGHTFTRYDDGFWYCACDEQGGQAGDGNGWTWRELNDDIASPRRPAQVLSPVPS